MNKQNLTRETLSTQLYNVLGNFIDLKKHCNRTKYDSRHLQKIKKNEIMKLVFHFLFFHASSEVYPLWKKTLTQGFCTGTIGPLKQPRDINQGSQA